jgi:hypothetical protein
MFFRFKIQNYDIIKLYLHQQVHQRIYTSVCLVVPVTNLQIAIETGDGPAPQVVATLILYVVKNTALPPTKNTTYTSTLI